MAAKNYSLCKLEIRSSIELFIAVAAIENQKLSSEKLHVSYLNRGSSPLSRHLCVAFSPVLLLSIVLFANVRTTSSNRATVMGGRDTGNSGKCSSLRNSEPFISHFLSTFSFFFFSLYLPHDCLSPSFIFHRFCPPTTTQK